MTEMDRRDEKTPWGLVILLGALTAFAPISIDLYLPALPTIGADLGATAAQTQLTVAAFLAGVAIYIASSVACAAAVSPEMLIGARFIQALGGCAGGVVARAVIRDRFGHSETARMLSLLTLVMGVAPILAPLVGGALLGLSGWRAIFWFLTAFGLICGVAAFSRLQETRSAATAAQAASESPLQAYAALLRQRRLVGYALAGALNSAALFTYISASPELLIGTYKVPAAQFGWVFGLNAAGVIGGSQVNRFLLRRWTPDEVLAKASLAAVAAALVMSLATLAGYGGPWVVLPLLFALLASYGFMQGNTMAGAMDVDPNRTGSVSALMGGASFAVGAAASSLTGVLHDGTARPMALTMLAAMGGSALALRLLALRGRGA